jgi:hypothetical protein
VADFANLLAEIKGGITITWIRNRHLSVREDSKRTTTVILSDNEASKGGKFKVCSVVE